MQGQVDKSAITYIACVASKISSTIKPWNAINRVKEVTGVEATLTSDKKRLILENKDANDIKISNFSATNTTTATVLNNDYQKTSSSISLGSSSSTNSK